MLVLTRKEGDALLIGRNIEIQVVKVKGKSVRLAIRAPEEVTILRKEVLESIREANLVAMLPKGSLRRKESG